MAMRGRAARRQVWLGALAGLLLAIPGAAPRPAWGDEAADKPASSEQKRDEAKDQAKKEQEARLALLPADSVTQHKVTVRGQALAYTATAGTLMLRDEKGEPTARVFYVGYTLAGAAPGRRPVSFFFNGGPGAGTAFLHLGAAGPMVLDFPAADPVDGGLATLHDNPDTWLPFTDMVFIDAVGTGYSLAAKPEEAPKRFWGMQQDGSAFAKVIELWLEKNGRATSPKYLVGESYGGVRSIKVATALQHEQGVIVNGVVMVSPVIEFPLIEGELPMVYAMRIPSFAAAALELQHKFAPPPVEDAYRWATGSYLATLNGPVPEGRDAEAFYREVAGRTGLPEEVVAKERGMLVPFAHDVRSRDGRLYTVYDMTVSIPDPAPEGVENEASPEPTLEGFGRAYGNAFAGYARDVLGFRTDLTYDLLDMEVNRHWDYKTGRHPYGGGYGDLKRLLALDPSLHVMIAHGYFDLVCPFSGSRWLIEHLPVGRERVALKLYKGGHMLYTRPDSRAALAADVAALIGHPG